MLAATALAALMVCSTSATAQSNSQVRNGRDIAPVPLNLSDLNPAQVGLPWPVYGKMSDRELHAIYEFLRAIPCLDPAGIGRCAGR